MTTPVVSWQNAGMFGPELEVNMDVAYATSLLLDAALAWVEALVEVQSHFTDLGTKRNHLFPIYHLSNYHLSKEVPF
jgi:hypothetical protein